MTIQSLSSYSAPATRPFEPGQATAAPNETIVDKFDTSHMPEDVKDQSEADRLAAQEAKANKHLKAFYAAGSVLDGAVRSIGQMGLFWTVMQGVLGNQVGGWIGVAGGVGGALAVADAAFQTKMAAVNRNTTAAINGTFSMVQGTGAVLTAMGLGRIPALVSVAAVVGKTAYGIYEASKAKKKKEAAEQEDAARRAAEKAAKEAPASQELAAPTAAQPVKRAVEAQPLTKSVGVGGSAFSAMRPILST